MRLKIFNKLVSNLDFDWSSFDQTFLNLILITNKKIYSSGNYHSKKGLPQKMEAFYNYKKI